MNLIFHRKSISSNKTMIKYLSDKLTIWLTKRGAIQADDTNLYRYASYNLIYTFTPIIPILCIAWFLHSFFGGILFFIAFILLRKYTGGFHFQSPGVCLFVSLISEFSFLFLATLDLPLKLWICLWGLSSLSLCFFSPVSNSKRILTPDDQHRCSKYTKIILVIIGLFCYILHGTGNGEMISYPLSATLMTAISQYPAIIQEKYVKAKRSNP